MMMPNQSIMRDYEEVFKKELEYVIRIGTPLEECGAT
jgi:hypothetical protein